MGVLLPSPQQCLQGLCRLPAHGTATPALPTPRLAQEPDTPLPGGLQEPR